MNDTINFGNFIDMLLNTEGEHKPHAIARCSLLPIPASAQAGYMMSYRTEEWKDNDSWHEE